MDWPSELRVDLPSPLSVLALQAFVQVFARCCIFSQQILEVVVEQSV